MSSGRETLGQIETALADLRGQESRVQRELDEASQKRASLAADRLAALKDLALTRVREAVADGVVSEADSLSDQVRVLLDARQRTITQSRARLDKAEAQRQTLIEQQEKLTAHIAGLEDTLDRTSEEARRVLASDPSYLALRKTHDDIAAMLDKARAKAEQAARTELERGKPYRDDPLFMYLWKRQYGSSAYVAQPLFAWLDSKVAGLVRYSDARANFAVLTEIPVRLREHADRLAVLVAAEAGRLDAMAAAKIKELAGTDAVAGLAKARAEQDVLIKQSEAVSAELNETGNQLRLYAEGEDQSYQSAVGLYTGFLQHESARALIAEAKATPTPTDDKIVERVLAFGDDIDALEKSIAEDRGKLDGLFQRKQELTRISGNFRRERYDDVGSVIDGIDTQDLLMLLLRGAITAAEYWARTQSGQRWRDRPADPWRRASGLPPLGDLLGGSRRGSSRSDGGFKGKDFRTGGTF